MTRCVYVGCQTVTSGGCATYSRYYKHRPEKSLSKITVAVVSLINAEELRLIRIFDKSDTRMPIPCSGQHDHECPGNK